MYLSFSWLFEYRQALLDAVGTTLWMTALGGTFGLILGICVAWLRIYGGGGARALVVIYVGVVRNTPFLVQLLFIFFGLPAMGLRLSAETSGIIALVINTGAYMGEILRGGIEATPAGQTEAAESLGMTRLQTFRHVILLPSIQRVWTAIVAQFVLDMFQTSVLSVIAVRELTFTASFIQSRNFRSFETYILMAFAYMFLSLIVSRLLLVAGYFLFPRGAAR